MRHNTENKDSLSLHLKRLYSDQYVIGVSYFVKRCLDRVYCLVVDLDECVYENICDQLCDNNEGSVTCSCRDNYMLSTDGRTCKAINGEILCAQY